MISKEEFLSLLNNRRVIYWILARICEREIKDQFLREFISENNPILKLDSLSDIDPEIMQGIEMIKNYVANAVKRDLKEVELELAVDYANVFLGVKKKPPHPSESVYKTGLLMQEPYDEVLHAYWEAGVDVVKDFKEPADHIAIELQFMSYLCRKALDALDKKDKENLLKYLKMQKEFHEKHLAQWVPQLAKDIQESADTDFYKGFAKIMGKYIHYDNDIINLLIDEVEKI
ncbi:MAG: molecular chaperone TorD family protein [Nitrososphaerota archaeon]